MREIKFRALSGENGEWEYFYLFNETDVRKLSERIQKGWIKGLSQFTSLLDKNGREIYEGDIVRFKLLTTAEDEGVFQIKWDEKVAGYWLENIEGVWQLKEYKDNAEIEIVGNIYQHQELLK